jgi:hypothetical protein
MQEQQPHEQQRVVQGSVRQRKHVRLQPTRQAACGMDECYAASMNTSTQQQQQQQQ